MRHFFTTCLTYYFDRSPQTLAERFREALSPCDWLPWANRTGHLIPAFGLASVDVFTTIYLVYSFLASVAMTIVAIVLRFTPYRDASIMVGFCAWLPTLMLIVLRIWVFWRLETLKDKAEEAMRDWRRMRERILLDEFRRENGIGMVGAVRVVGGHDVDAVSAVVEV